MQKNASQKCKKDAGAKTQCKRNASHWSDLLFVRFFCIVVLPFFCFCLVFFCLFVHLPRLLQLFPEIMFVQLVPGLICFFFSFFLLFAQVFQLFSEIMFVQLAPGLICCFFLHVFAFLFFAPFRVAFFNCVFSFFAFVLFASPASALLICMFFALFLFFPS